MLIVISRRVITVISGVFVAAMMSLSAFCMAGDTLIGRAAPQFKVVSGEGQALTLRDIKGKVAVVFYESKDTVEENRKLKSALNAFYMRQPGPLKNEIARIGIISCQGVLFRGAWEKGLRDNSAKEGITIYGDWDGKMSKDYRFKRGENNVIIIDKNGIIRYSACGKVEDKDIAAIERLLERLLKGNPRAPGKKMRQLSI